MRKLFLSASVVLLIVLGANFILRYIYNDAVKVNVDALSDKFLKHGVKLKYKDIKFVNFLFFESIGYISNLEISKDSPEFSDTTTFERIDFYSSVFKKEMKLTFPKELYTKIKDFNNDKESYVYVSRFEDNSIFSIVFKKYFFRFKSNDFESLINLSNIVEKANYKAYKHSTSVIFKDYEEKLYDIAHSDFDFHSRDGALSVKIDLDNLEYQKPKNFDRFDFFYDLMSKLGKNSFQLDMNALFNDKGFYKIDINNLYIPSDRFSVKSSGKLKFNNDNMIPFFSLDVVFKDFNNLLDFFADFYNLMVSKMELDHLNNSKISSLDKENLLKIFNEISESLDDGSRLLLFSRYENQEIKLGQYSLADVKKMFLKNKS